MEIKLDTNSFFTGLKGAFENSILTGAEFLDEPVLDVDLDLNLSGRAFYGPAGAYVNFFNNRSRCNCRRCRRRRRNQCCPPICPPICPPPCIPIPPPTPELQTAVTITSPAADEIVTEPQPIIMGTAAPNTTVNVCIDHITCEMVTADLQGYWHLLSPVIFFGSGEHIISVSVVNTVRTNINYKEITIQTDIL